MKSAPLFLIGICTALALFLFFLIMDVLSIAHIWELRFFNAFILLIGIRYAILKSKDFNTSYLTGFFSGVKTSIIAVLTFLLLFSIYTTLINPDFFEALDAKRLSPFTVDKFLIVPAIFFEGICSGIILTFISMQYYKNTSNAV